MYRSIRNSHIPPPPGNPPGIWTFQFSCGQIPHPGAKNPFKCPTSRLNSVLKCPTSGPLFPRKSDVNWAEIFVSIVFPDVTNRILMSATLNIGSPMITEGYGSCFSIWRQTRAVSMRNAARNIKSRRRIKFPTPLGLWSNAPPQVRCGPSNSPLPGQGRGSNARGMPGVCPGYARGMPGGGGGGGDVRISNWSVHNLRLQGNVWHSREFLPLIPTAAASNQHKAHRRRRLTSWVRLFRISSLNRSIFRYRWNPHTFRYNLKLCIARP